MDISTTNAHRQSMLPVTALVDPVTGLTVVTMPSWSCLVKRFTNRCSFSANSHSSKAPAWQQSNKVQLNIKIPDLVWIFALKSAVYPSLRPQQHFCLKPIWHLQLQPQSAHQPCRVPRWGLWQGCCRSREIPANTCHQGWRHRAAEFHLCTQTRKTIACIKE